MNEEVYVVRLIDRDNDVNKLIGVIKDIQVIDKIIYQLREEQGLEFEFLTRTRSNEYWIFRCISNEMFYLRVDKVGVIE